MSMIIAHPTSRNGHTTLDSVVEKVHAGERLTIDDGVVLYETPDIWTLCELANLARTRMHGRVAYYNVNRHLNPTNVCIYTYDCKFCSFAALKGEDHAWEMSHDEVYERAAQQGGNDVTEFHIVGGLHPHLPFDYYTGMLRAIREAAPTLHIKAFTAVEIVHLARISKRGRQKYEGLKAVLRDLVDAGLGSLPGGGAEVFDDRVHDEAFKGKIRAGTWLDVHRAAHELGINSNATMLYGHVETVPEKVDHLLRLRDLQDETGGFVNFIPLAFHPANTQMSELPETTGYADLRNIAVARLLLDNFDHIKAYWIMLSIPVTQVALAYGADDVDGTVVEEHIYHDAGAQTPQRVQRDELISWIRDAGRVPVERDTLYNVVWSADTDRAPVGSPAPVTA